MLTLKNITKDYSMGDEVVHALRGVSIKFRPNEFVAILGPSGCGKTTLLNIIGGLDHYTDGDLVISGKSTKEYKDRDWDAYRNHRVGFVFQSYNLIPHQTVLSNVELALTLSGVSRAERHARAAKALENVGLGEQLKKKPGQMSGGQMQRVAIARALVNDPDIILADEPTGALDTTTSVQIMEILRSISDKKLIIMVTHNPEIAEQYATRIIRVKDGLVVEDTNPYVVDDAPKDQKEALDFAHLRDSDLQEMLIASVDPRAEGAKELIEAYRHGDRESLVVLVRAKGVGLDKLSERARYRYLMATEGTAAQKACEGKTTGRRVKKERTSMSFWTALSLSLNNLMTKKTRTFLTAFAGSIGIIGIALILALSNGINIFIDRVQEDTLSTYPLQIMEQSQDLSAMMGAMTAVDDSKGDYRDSGKIWVDDSMGTMMSAMNKVQSNNLVAFKEYIDQNYDKIKDDLSAIQYTYHFDLQVFSGDGKTQVNPTTIFESMGSGFGGIGELMSTSGMKISAMSEMIDNPELLASQYDLLEGKWPTEANELVLVVSKNNQISKLALYMLGVLPQDEVADIIKDIMSGKGETTAQMPPYEFSDFIGREFLLVNTSDYFVKTSETYTVGDKTYPKWDDLRDNVTYNQENFAKANGTKLKISGIIRPSEGGTAASIGTALAYTKGLTNLILEKNEESAIIKQQYETPTHNVLTGFEFEKKEYNTIEDLVALIPLLDDNTIAELGAMIGGAMQNMVASTSGFVKGIFSLLFDAMSVDQQRDVLGQMLAIAATKDPTNAILANVCQNMLSDQALTVTPDNLLTVFPVLSQEKRSVAVETLKTICTEEGMEPIYQYVTVEIGNMKVDRSNLAQILTLVYTLSQMAGAPGAPVNPAADEPAMPGAGGELNYFEMLKNAILKGAPQIDETKDSILKKLGDSSAARPASINFYPTNFESKDKIIQFIADYNAGVKDSADEIKYTDLVGILMSSITTILDVITYVLIAFVSISLVVSSIMIGIITYISVLERIKEIGILRAIGASKRNVSQVFLAETLIVGFIAGLLGIIVTLLLCIPINLIIGALTAMDVGAQLPIGGAIILIAISTVLTLVAGLIPARIAAKKEPVDALRSE